MKENNQIISMKNIQGLIFTIRGNQVMIDRDLAELYGVEIRVLNQAVKRNIMRFPENFRFQLSKKEYQEFLRSQNVILEEGKGKHRKYLPYVFNEQGVAMLSAVLRSETAIKVSVQIMQAFVEMKKFISTNAGIFQRLDKFEQKLVLHDEKFNKIFKALEDKSIKPNQEVFFNGQIFDAYSFVSDLVRTAKKSIILIDNYVDDTVLTHFTKRKKRVMFTIFTQKISKQLELDVKKHNEQYPPIEIKIFKEAHDRFLIIDEKDVYHFGASLKDLGKKWFAVSKMNIASVKVLDKVKLIVSG